MDPCVLWKVGIKGVANAVRASGRKEAEGLRTEFNTSCLRGTGCLQSLDHEYVFVVEARILGAAPDVIESERLLG